MARKKQPEYRGVYIGINREGKVQRVSEHWDSGTVLSTMSGDANYVRHAVMRGSDPRAEVVIVFGLREIEFVHPGNNEYEKEVVERLKRVAAETAGGGGSALTTG